MTRQPLLPAPQQTGARESEVAAATKRSAPVRASASTARRKLPPSTEEIRAKIRAMMPRTKKVD